MQLPRKVRLDGFTLVELVVSVSVMAILATAAAPSFIDFLDKNRVRGAADEVASLISNARAAAVKSDRDVSVAMAGTGAAWCIGANGAPPPVGGMPAGAAVPCDCTDPSAPAECLVGGQRFAVDVGAHPDVQVGALFDELTFDGTLGVVSSLDARSVVLTSPSGKYDIEIRVNPLGQAYLCIPEGKPVIAGIASCPT